MLRVLLGQIAACDFRSRDAAVYQGLRQHSRILVPDGFSVRHLRIAYDLERVDFDGFAFEPLLKALLRLQSALQDFQPGRHDVALRQLGNGVFTARDQARIASQFFHVCTLVRQGETGRLCNWGGRNLVCRKASTQRRQRNGHHQFVYEFSHWPPVYEQYASGISRVFYYSRANKWRREKIPLALRRVERRKRSPRTARESHYALPITRYETLKSLSYSLSRRLRTSLGSGPIFSAASASST